MTHVDHVLAEIAEGRSGATLIEWGGGVMFDMHDPEGSIRASRRDFQHAGWTWKPKEQRIEREGWCAFWRSQGQLAPPVIQWQKFPCAEAGGAVK